MKPGHPFGMYHQHICVKLICLAFIREVPLNAKKEVSCVAVNGSHVNGNLNLCLMTKIYTNKFPALLLHPRTSFLPL